MVPLSLKSVSWQRMSDAVDNVRRRLLHTASCLDNAGVPYAVIGGNAVAAWVSRVDDTAVRNTRDVDILLRRADLPRAITALEQAGYRHRQVASLGSGGTMDVFLDGDAGKVRDAVHVLFAGERIRPDALAPNEDVADSEDVDGFRLISLAALIRMKLAAWRDKDRMHLRDLQTVGLLEKDTIPGLTPLLEERLDYILEHPED